MQRLASSYDTSTFAKIWLPSGKRLEVNGFGRNHALWVDLLEPDASRSVLPLSQDKEYPLLHSRLTEGHCPSHHAVDVVFEIEGRHYHVHSHGRSHGVQVRIVRSE